ncbi:Matrix metalloproteinase-23 [Acipenser ruthenus]|uniref:Matrix metalloproteinase-23 n=1 Tax=Acipenser ruthenus TaxID=7906 RepID=A0A444V0C4_ACIRT|nr:Matrix metalloproteinase-23 [Acipenser ruthenus]
MDERSPLLIHRYSDSADLPNPNLRPRHRELIPTPCGPIKPWSELTCLVKLYYCLTIVSLLAVLAVTAVNIYKQIQDPLHHEDFTISLVQLVGILFCCYYVTRGILQENRQELIVFVASVVLVMMRSVVNFAVLPAPEKDSLILVRFVCIVCIGLFHVICSTLLIRSSNMMAFRVGGALESLQEQYFLLNVCFSMVTFDLQAQICLCILVLTSGIYHISFSHSIILGFGIFWACLTSTVGMIANPPAFSDSSLRWSVLYITQIEKAGPKSYISLYVFYLWWLCLQGCRTLQHSPPGDFRLLSFPRNLMNESDTRKGMAAAFTMWSDVSPFSFREVPDDQEADIKIGFYPINHTDCLQSYLHQCFDGITGELAHAFFPPTGEIHFDDSEYWVLGNMHYSWKKGKECRGSAAINL